MRKMGLRLEDAEDVFQDAALAFYEQLQDIKPTILSNPEGYLHGICRHLALKRIDELNRKRDYIDEDKLDRLLELTADDEDGILIAEEPDDGYVQIVRRLLSEMTQRDRSLISGFYLEGKSMKHLAEELQLATVEAVRTTKCRILSRMRDRALVLINEYY